MQNTLINHELTIKVGGRAISKVRFADYIDVLAGSEEELQNLTDSLEKAVSTEKQKNHRLRCVV